MKSASSEDIPKYVSNDDGAILKYYMALLEKWYLEYPEWEKRACLKPLFNRVGTLRQIINQICRLRKWRI